MRSIEEQNPDIRFDWPKILDAKAPSGPPPDDPRFRRGRRPAGERRSAPIRQPEVEPDVRDEVDTTDFVMPADDPGMPVDGPGVPQEDPAVVAPPPPDLAEPLQTAPLRARYAEILARISERGGDDERIAALRIQAEALNPDGWVTADDIKAGVENYERRLQDLRAALGLHRRRRSRRGGRRRRAVSGGANSPAVAAPDTSNENQD
jgi:hypothetical protein